MEEKVVHGLSSDEEEEHSHGEEEEEEGERVQFFDEGALVVLRDNSERGSI